MEFGVLLYEDPFFLVVKAPEAGYSRNSSYGRRSWKRRPEQRLPRTEYVSLRTAIGRPDRLLLKASNAAEGRVRQKLLR